MSLDVNKAFKYLSSKDFLDYGKELPTYILEVALRLVYSHDDMKWIGSLLKLKSKLEYEGYFCKTFDSHSRIKILECDEIEYKLNKDRKNYEKNKKRSIEGMNKVDTSVLNNSEKEKFKYIQNIYIMDLQAMKSILNEFRKK